MGLNLTKWHKGSFLVGKENLGHMATFSEDGNEGLYNLCRSKHSTADAPESVLFYNASGASQPVIVADHAKLKEARTVLLAWHKTDDNCPQCVDAGSGN